MCNTPFGCWISTHIWRIGIVLAQYHAFGRPRNRRSETSPNSKRRARSLTRARAQFRPRALGFGRNRPPVLLLTPSRHLLTSPEALRGSETSRCGGRSGEIPADRGGDGGGEAAGNPVPFPISSPSQSSSMATPSPSCLPPSPLPSMAAPSPSRLQWSSLPSGPCSRLHPWPVVGPFPIPRHPVPISHNRPSDPSQYPNSSLPFADQLEFIA